MTSLEARVLALERGPRGGPLLLCEIASLGRASAEPVPACSHKPTTLAQVLAGMPELDADGRPAGDQSGALGAGGRGP